jgi:transcriptional regulator with XRE-family HTH domain
MDIAKRVKTVRESKGISVYKLAQLSGISSTYLYEIELGKKQPTVEIISRICNALDISLETFFAENKEEIKIPLVGHKLVKKSPP